MGKLINELAAEITLEQRVNFTLKQDVSFQSKVAKMDVEEYVKLDEKVRLHLITKTMETISPDDLFNLIDSDMFRKWINENFKK